MHNDMKIYLQSLLNGLKWVFSHNEHLICNCCHQSYHLVKLILFIFPKIICVKRLYSLNSIWHLTSIFRDEAVLVATNQSTTWHLWEEVSLIYFSLRLEVERTYKKFIRKNTENVPALVSDFFECLSLFVWYGQTDSEKKTDFVFYIAFFEFKEWSMREQKSLEAQLFSLRKWCKGSWCEIYWQCVQNCQCISTTCWDQNYYGFPDGI